MPCNLCGKWNCVCQYSQPKQQQDFTSCFFSREAMKEHSDFHPQPKQEQDKPAIDKTPSQPAIDTTPQPKQEEQEPVAVVTGVYGGRFTYAPIKASVVLPVGMALYTHPQPKAKQEPTSGFFSREAMKEHSDFHPQTKAGQGEPVFHLRQYGDVTKEQLDCYIATGRIDTRPQPKQEQDEPATLEEIRKAMIFGIPLYTTPQQRTWVDLTGEELETLLRENRSLTLGAIWAVADKLKEKNT